jgi:hypothetical protein
MIDLEPIAEHDRELRFSGTPFACRHFPIFRDLAHGVAANRQKHDLLAHLHALQRTRRLSRAAFAAEVNPQRGWATNRMKVNYILDCDATTCTVLENGGSRVNLFMSACPFKPATPDREG